MEVIYARANNDVRSCGAALVNGLCGSATALPTGGAVVLKDSQSNVTGRLRVERNF